MARGWQRTSAIAVLVTLACASGPIAAPASALNPLKPICKVGGLISGIAGKACNAATHPGRLLGAGKKLLAGHPLGAVKTALGAAPSGATTAVGLAAVGAWVLGGAKFALRETASVLAKTTAPQLRTTWFSSTYWRMAGIAAVLTMPFLFAAAVQAVIRGDITLLARAALGHLPLAMLAVSVAAPITMLLLAASDELSAVVSAAAGNASGRFLNQASGVVGGLTLASRSPFLAFLLGLLMVAGTIVVWLELFMREAAVYVIVLMLPLAFAAFVWPARRVWAVRAVEVLVALILAKFAIVAVLSLGGAAMASGVGHASITSVLTALVLLVMCAFAPWALLRLVPLTELASGAVGSLRLEARPAAKAFQIADAGARGAEDWAAATVSSMRHDVMAPRPADGQVESDSEAASSQRQRLADWPEPQRSRDESAGRGESQIESPLHGANGSAEPANGPAGRAPGLGPMFQVEDWSWAPMVLGLDEDGGPPRLRSWDRNSESLDVAQQAAAREVTAEPAPPAPRPEPPIPAPQEPPIPAPQEELR